MLTTAHVWTAFLIHIGAILTAVAYFVVAGALLPNATERAAMRLSERPVATALLGVLISAPWVAVSLFLLGRGGVAASLGALLGMLWLLLGLLGGGAVAYRVGQVGHGWPRIARGGTIVALTWVLPLVGWFVVLPLTLSTGVACLLLSARRRTVAT